MIHDGNLLSRMDACRAEDLAGSRGNLPKEVPAELSDLVNRLQADPTLRRQFERIQSLDQRISLALDEVEVPAGLTSRILGRLAAEHTSRQAQASASALVTTMLQAAVEQEVSNAAARAVRPWPRRRVIVAAVLALAACVLVGFWLRPGETAYSHDSLALAGRELFQAGAGAAKPLDRFQPPTNLPLSAQIRALPGTRWAAVRQFAGRGGVVYELGKGRLRAALYVVRIAGNPRSPKIVTTGLPSAPQPTSTGGLTTAVWQEHGRLYVLVVEGSESEYQQFLASTPVVT